MRDYICIDIIGPFGNCTLTGSFHSCIICSRGCMLTRYEEITSVIFCDDSYQKRLHPQIKRCLFFFFFKLFACVLSAWILLFAGHFRCFFPPSNLMKERDAAYRAYSICDTFINSSSFVMWSHFGGSLPITSVSFSRKRLFLFQQGEDFGKDFMKLSRSQGHSLTSLVSFPFMKLFCASNLLKFENERMISTGVIVSVVICPSNSLV